MPIDPMRIKQHANRKRRPRVTAHEDDEELAARIAAQVAAGKVTPGMAELIGEYAEDGLPPEWADSAETWDRARTAVGGEEGAYADFWLVVGSVYVALGGVVTDA